jgi:ADP-heptose:LPS heptosyltransferase
MPDVIRKILIFKWGALGDILASTPAINMVIKKFPDSQIDIVGNTLFTEIFPVGETFYKKIFDIRSNKLDLIKNIRKEKYDLVINLKWTSEGAAWITLFSGAKYRAGSGPKDYRFAYNLKSDFRTGRYHEVIRNTEIIEGMGITGEKIEFITYVDKDSKEKIENFLIEKKITDKFILGVHPGASKDAKSWPIDRFVKAIKEIRTKYDINVVIFYGRQELTKAKYITEQIGDPNVFLGPETHSIRELTAAIHRCNLFFCNNSGPMNVSVALGIPTVAILGSTHPDDWRPFGDQHITIKSPLYLHSFSEVDEKIAMEAIRIDKVVKVLSKKISELI